ncbi:MAG TPA: cohesin domain-containing protein [Myxococcales bacterium]
MLRAAGSSLFALLLLLAQGCNQDVNVDPRPGKDAGTVVVVVPPDAGPLAGPDAGPVEPQVPTFVVDAPLSDGEMGLQAANPLTADGAARIDVVLGRHDNVYGIAGGLTYDPAALEFVRVEGAGWLEGADGLVVAKAGPSGKLVFAVTRKGVVAGEKVDAPRAVGTLVFKVLKSGASALAFLPERSTVRSDGLDYSSKSPAFRGGTLSIP